MSFMTKMYMLIALVAAMALSGFLGVNYSKKTNAHAVDISAEVAELERLRAKEEADSKLGQYIINMMYMSAKGKSLSNGRKIVLARQIVRVVNDIFETEEQKKAFVAAISIESEFQRFAQSPTGPKGMTQVAKAAFEEATKDCGIDARHSDDVWDSELNLYAGACYFRKMLELPGVDGEPFMAIVAYNQGPNAESIKTFSRHGRLDNTEALKYVAKFTFLKRKVSDQPKPGVPDIKELKIINEKK